MQTLLLNDLEVSKRLINVAIKLHFSNSDPVAIQALANTAYKLLRKLSIQTKIPDIVPEYLNYLCPHDRRLFWSSLTAFDPLTHPIVHGTATPPVEFASEVTDLQIFITCAMVKLLDHRHTHEMKIYIIWYKAINRLKAKADPIYNEKTQEGFDYLKSLPRERQLKMGFDALRNIQV